MRNRQQLLLFVLLVAIGVTGRVFTPAENFTPIAAVGVFAGFLFDRWWKAALVPLAAMAIADAFFLSPHSHPVMQLVVYASLGATVLLGCWLRRDPVPSRRWLGKLPVLALAPATWFFLVSNFLVWKSSDWLSQEPAVVYDQGLAGLLSCYAAALPFYRNMLCGDCFYLTLLLGAYAVTSLRQASPAKQSRILQPRRVK